MRKRINVMIEEEAYKRIKEYAKADNRSAAKEMSLILELYRPGLIPGISVMALGVTPTPAQQIIQQPFIYTPTTTTPIQDTSQMTKIEQAEYAKKILDQAEVSYAKELKQLEITKKENTELLKQLRAEEKQAQAKVLTPEEQEIQKQKLELQKQKIQEKRDKLVKDKAKELGLWGAENYTEGRVLFEIYQGDWANYDFEEKHYGKPNPLRNKPMEEIYRYMQDIKTEEEKEEAEEERRAILPHDIGDFDYKDEDFYEELQKIQDNNISEYGADTYDDEDYKLLLNYFVLHRRYKDFIFRLQHSYEAFDERSSKDEQDLINAFDCTKKTLDMNYAIALMQGRGERYRQEHSLTSYFDQYNLKRQEWQRTLDDDK